MALPVAGKPRAASAFSLIELMLTLLIAALIASLAYPGYQRFVLRAYRAQAAEAALSEAARQEQRYLAGQPFTQIDAYPAAGGRYRITVTVNETGSTYRIDAAPAGKQQRDACGRLSIDHLDQKTSEFGDAALCWRMR